MTTSTRRRPGRGRLQAASAPDSKLAVLELARGVIEGEGRAVSALLGQLDDRFVAAVEAMIGC